jgi:hypothetical protein
MNYYIAKRDIHFSSGSNHFKGRCYFPSPETQSYFNVCEEDYVCNPLLTIEVENRVIASPNHNLGYTKSYLLGWMEANSYLSHQFTKWIAGQTVGVSDDNETVYYYNDVVRYLTTPLVRVLAEVED